MAFYISKHLYLLFERINVVLIPDNHLSFMYSIYSCWYKPGSKCLSYFPGIENVIVDSAAPDKEIRKYHCSAHGCRVAVQPCSCAAVYVTVGLKQNVRLAKWCYHTQALSCRNNRGFTLPQKVVKRQISTCVQHYWTLVVIFYCTKNSKKKKKKKFK